MCDCEYVCACVCGGVSCNNLEPSPSLSLHVSSLLSLPLGFWITFVFITRTPLLSCFVLCSKCNLHASCVAGDKDELTSSLHHKFTCRSASSSSAMDLTDLTGPASVRQPWWELCASVCAASARIFRGILFYPAYLGLLSLSLSARAWSGWRVTRNWNFISFTIRDHKEISREWERERERMRHAPYALPGDLDVVAVLRPFAGRSQRDCRLGREKKRAA